MAVTSEMIAIALGQSAPLPNSASDLQWVMWIQDATMLIDTRKLALAIVTPIDQVKLDYVVREAVVAHIKKPDDATQVTVSVDDASTSKSYRSGRGRVTILDEWWALLGLVQQTGAYSVEMVGGANIHLPWCASYFGAAYCSCGVDIAGYPIFENIN